MSDRNMLMVYCYDISRPRTRSRVADLLERQAVRVQDSVFEVRLSKAASLRLFEAVKALIDPGDSLRMYGVSASGRARCRTTGGADISEDGDYWLI